METKKVYGDMSAITGQFLPELLIQLKCFPSLYLWVLPFIYLLFIYFIFAFSLLTVLLLTLVEKIIVLLPT